MSVDDTLKREFQVNFHVMLFFGDDAGLSTSHVFKYGEHDFPGKSPYRGVARCIKAKFTGGGGGGEAKYINQ